MCDTNNAPFFFGGTTATFAKNQPNSEHQTHQPSSHLTWSSSAPVFLDDGLSPFPSEDKMRNKNKILTGFEKCQVQLGQGHFSVVSLWRHSGSGDYCAVKKISRSSDFARRSADAEAHVLETLPQNRNVVHLFAPIAKEVDNFYVPLDFMPSDLRRTLADAARTKSFLPETHVLFYLRDVMLGLRHLHAHNIMHRDIKPSNVLLSPDPNTSCGVVAKLSDFGLAMPYLPSSPSPRFSVEGTPGYHAPELILGLTTPLSVHHVDMWCCGCLLAELLVGESIFDRTTSVRTLHSIFSLLGRPTPEVWPEARDTTLYPQALLTFDRMPAVSADLGVALGLFARGVLPETVGLLTQLLTLDPRRRITAQQALDHPAFAVLSHEGNAQLNLPVPAPTTKVQRTLLQVEARKAGLSPSSTLINQQMFTPPPAYRDADCTPPRRLFDS
eukprot:PhM_4_TR4852/c0_g1_i1/m.2587